MTDAIRKIFSWNIPVIVLIFLLNGCSHFQVNNTPRQDKDIPPQEERLKTTGR